MVHWDAVAARRRYLAGLAEQAERERAADAERARQEVREERVRIARELHDVVAHALAVVILTTFDLDQYVFEALSAGASGFALKSRPLDELLSAIRIVAEGEALLAPSVTRRLIAHFSRASRLPPQRRRDLEQLTEREREMLSLVAGGLSNTDLAETLHVSLPTVKTHVSRILTKLGARDRTQLVVFAYEAGLAPAP
jgi:DNA-binding NarL/FixJ family response regulator